jgi:hypothetical protein
MEIELGESVTPECLRDSLVQLARQRRCPRTRRRDQLGVRQLLTFEKVIPERGADRHSAMVASGHRGALLG